MRGKALRFAAFAGVSLFLTYYIAAQITGLDPGASRYALVATFDDATNLRDGDPVRLAGVRVGRVSGVDVVDGRAEVRFAVDDDIELPVDSTVTVQWLNLIGQRELGLQRGSDRTLLTDGDRVERTRSVVDIGALLDELGPLTQAVDPLQVNSLVEALVTALAGNREEAAAVVDHLDTVLATLAARSGTIEQLVTDYAALSGVVARRDLEMQQIVDNLGALTAAFADSGDVLVSALDELPGSVGRLAALLDANADELGSTLASLAAVTGEVHAHLGDLDTTLAGFPSALDLVFRSSSYGNALLVNLLCVSPDPPPCRHPVILAASAPGAGELSGPDAFGAALLGVGP